MESTLKRYFKGDRVIWLIIVLLSVVSLLAVYSSTGSLAYRYQGGNTAYYFIKQFSFLGIGLMVIFLVHLIPYKVYSPLSPLLLYIAIPLLLVTLLFGTNINQATRWLEIPGLGVTIQTSDFAKLALVVYVARILSLKQNYIKDLRRTFFPLVIPISIVCLLILPANFSTALMLALVCWIMLFVGRVSLKHLLGFSGLAIALVGLFVFIALQTNSVNRVQTWKNRVEGFSSGKVDVNYQAQQSKIAIATGGLVGKGPGNSTQRNMLPHPYSDFIYAIIIEEYGMIGGILVLFFYMVLLFRAGLIIKKARRTFPAFLAMGLTLLLVFQAMVNMAVAVNLIPVTGQPLPLVSMGGTSLLFTSASFGILLSISRSQNKEELFDGEDPQDNN
ncbi:MAG: putative peptidoglycan glycosyltransferase FtsW [Bacteroidales bacterium]|nr:putative peptidoglycan glycosyltransferase FtsW [Bacteroidales bacterium]MDD3891473.1 putative peptidoglycan glycosyltransferase FtsW [Bacteroidales bacterium]